MPTIASILTVSGLATNQGQGHPRTGRVALVGVVLDDGRAGWGTCPLGMVADPDRYPDQPEVAQVAAVMSDLAAPALEGRPLDDWVALAERVEALVETVTITRPLPEPEESGLSRRAVLTGRLQKPAEAPVERVTIERPLHPALRFGLSQALLAAWALWQDVSPAAALAEMIGLGLAQNMIPIQSAVRGGQAISMDPAVAALSYEVTAADPWAGLGPGGEKLQRFVRQLRQAMAVAVGPEERPTIHLQLGGRLGQLFDGDLGKVLGALSGLQQSAAPFPLRVEDPLWPDNLPARRVALGQLRDYLRLRRMSVTLAAGGFAAEADLRAFLQGEGQGGVPPVQTIHLDVVRFGALHRTVAAVDACRQAGVGVLLSGGPAENLAHVALAAQPDVVAVPPGPDGLARLHNEMARLLAAPSPHL